MKSPAFELDNYDLNSFSHLAENFGQAHFGYVVTPNTDHLIRMAEERALREAYAKASYIVLDSRFVALMMKLIKGVNLPVCAGSDLTEKLLAGSAHSDDRIVLIGASPEHADRLRERYGLRGLVHHNPPMGFIRRPVEVEDCLRFVEAHSPFRYCLLAVGSPQQEIVAEQLRARRKARGLALCIGASINFLTGVERRAPRWMRVCGLEWCFRLMLDPGRLAYRYLVRGPRIFPLLQRSRFSLRDRSSEV